MQPTFNQYHPGYGAELKCPSCGEPNLHHGEVQVFERGEDQQTGVHVTVSEGHATMDTSLKGNPSARRHGMVGAVVDENGAVRIRSLSMRMRQSASEFSVAPAAMRA